MAPIPTFFNSRSQFRAEPSPELNSGALTSTGTFSLFSAFLDLEYLFLILYLFNIFISSLKNSFLAHFSQKDEKKLRAVKQPPKQSV